MLFNINIQYLFIKVFSNKIFCKQGSQEGDQITKLDFGANKKNRANVDVKPKTFAKTQY